MFQVGELIRCDVDGEFGVVVEKKEVADSAETPMYITVYKVIWQGSTLRSELGDPLLEWLNESEIMSDCKYTELKKNKKSLTSDPIFAIIVGES